MTQLIPTYLLLGKLPNTPFVNKHMFYAPVDEVRRLAKLRTVEYHHKNKVNYDVFCKI